MIQVSNSVGLTDANPLLRAIREGEEVRVQFLVVRVHRRNLECRRVNGCKGENQVRQAGGVDVGRPYLVARPTPGVPV